MLVILAIILSVPSCSVAVFNSAEAVRPCQGKCTMIDERSTYPMLPVGGFGVSIAKLGEVLNCKNRLLGTWLLQHVVLKGKEIRRQTYRSFPFQ